MANNYDKLYEDITTIKEVYNEGIITNDLKIKNIKAMSKCFYNSNVSVAKDFGKNTLNYYETCVWGHIHNLNKDRAEKALKKFEDVLSTIINEAIFDGKPMEVVVLDTKTDTFTNKPKNEDTFRTSCEKQQLRINIFKIMIDLL
jgi:hypothetical protein